jgi:hypothetical protein
MHSTSTDLDSLKDALPSYLESIYGNRIKKRTAHSITMSCPLHEDKNPSFSANNSKGTWLFKCFSCGASGSIIDLHAQANGYTARSRENIESAAQAAGVTLPRGRELSKREKSAWAKRKHEAAIAELRHNKREHVKQEITESIQNQLEDRLAPYVTENWQLDLLDVSPIRFDDPDAAPRDLVQMLFKPSDILWLGTPYDSGFPKHATNFRTCSEWCKEAQLPPRIAAGTFKEGSTSRCKDNVLTSPFIVLESDTLIGYKPQTPSEKERNKQLGAALTIYAQKVLGLHLRAVVDTGNKSLHSWFNRPPCAALDAIKSMAEGLRLDAGVIDSCPFSPLRMPHCIHSESNQQARLLYLNPTP